MHAPPHHAALSNGNLVFLAKRSICLTGTPPSMRPTPHIAELSGSQESPSM